MNIIKIFFIHWGRVFTSPGSDEETSVIFNSTNYSLRTSKHVNLFCASLLWWKKTFVPHFKFLAQLLFSYFSHDAEKISDISLQKPCLYCLDPHLTLFNRRVQIGKLFLECLMFERTSFPVSVLIPRKCYTVCFLMIRKFRVHIYIKK